MTLRIRMSEEKVALARQLDDAHPVPHADVPFMYEVWNWEGDTSVLPGKWASVVQAAFGEDGPSGGGFEYPLWFDNL